MIDSVGEASTELDPGELDTEAEGLRAKALRPEGGRRDKSLRPWSARFGPLHRARISKGNEDRVQRRKTNGREGKTHSDETKAKIAANSRLPQVERSRLAREKRYAKYVRARKRRMDLDILAAADMNRPDLYYDVIFSGGYRSCRTLFDPTGRVSDGAGPPPPGTGPKRIRPIRDTRRGPLEGVDLATLTPPGALVSFSPASPTDPADEKACT